MEQRWEVRQMWERARSPESPGGIAIVDCEATPIYEKVYAPEGLDHNTGRTCSMVEYAYRLFGGTKGMDSQNWLRGITAWLRGVPCSSEPD